MTATRAPRELDFSTFDMGIYAASTVGSGECFDRHRELGRNPDGASLGKRLIDTITEIHD
jgi:hypothetical protein